MREEFRYFYIKKGEVVESERKPGRIFHFGTPKAPHPQRRGVTSRKGELSIHDDCSLNTLKFSKVTPQILVGSYPRSRADLQLLKENNVSAIFSIQSERDFRSHGLSPHYFKLLCEEHGIKFRLYEIEDMNNADFIERADGGLSILSELVREGMTVYIHCSAGMYRSPQMIVLYLAMCEQNSVEQAIHTVKSTHPFARPSSRVIREAIGVIRSRHRSNHSF